MEPLPFALALCCLLAVVAVLMAVAAVVVAVWRRPNVYQTQGDRYIEAPVDGGEDDEGFIPSDADLAEIEAEVAEEADDLPGDEWKHGRRPEGD